MAGSPTKPGNWGDWAVIEHKPKEQNSCEACIHYRADGSCGIYPIVIREVGYNYWRRCKSYRTEPEALPQKKKKQIPHSTQTTVCYSEQTEANLLIGDMLSQNKGPQTNIKLCDIHAHIVFGVDEGACNEENALATLRYLASKGFRNVVCTSHNWQNEEKYSVNFSKLKQTVKNEKINIRLHKGSEIRCDKSNVKELIEKINAGMFLCVNEGKYVLVEFEEESLSEDILYCIERIKKKTGKYSILSRAEYYQDIQKRPEFIAKLKKQSCLFQINLSSLVDQKNVNVITAAQRLLAEKHVDFVGSNTHCQENDCLMIPKGIRYILEHCDTAYARRILEKNAKTFLDIV